MAEMSERQRRALEAWDRENAESSAPAGWYPHPSMPGTQRYWNGSEWTSDIAPATTPAARPVPEPSAASGRVIGWGYVLAVFLPPIGFIIGLVVLVTGEKHGAAMMIVAFLAVLLLWGVY